jgi:hypothetical protein
MAVHAVLFDRSVLVQEWSPLFRMALVAKFIVRIRLDHMLTEAAVRTVAVVAQDLALVDRVVRLTHRLRADVLVARIAEYRFRLFQVLPGCNMARVTV